MSPSGFLAAPFAAEAGAAADFFDLDMRRFGAVQQFSG
jgi:hypothetical protein